MPGDLRTEHLVELRRGDVTQVYALDHLHVFKPLSVRGSSWDARLPVLGKPASHVERAWARLAARLNPRLDRGTSSQGPLPPPPALIRYSALTHTQYFTRRVPGVPGSAQRRCFNSGHAIFAGRVTLHVELVLEGDSRVLRVRNERQKLTEGDEEGAGPRVPPSTQLYLCALQVSVVDSLPREALGCEIQGGVSSFK